MTAGAAVASPPRPAAQRSGALVRNASALMVSTAASAALGFVFWVVAVRWFPPALVGQASALVASITLLAGLAQLNLVSLFARFLPGAGRRTRRLIAGGAGASVVMSLLLCAVYLGLGLADSLGGGGTLWSVGFTLAVVASALYFIVDGVLTPLGRAAWVPVKNLAAAAAKLGLLAGATVVGLRVTAPTLVVAWMVPVVVAVTVVGGLILFRLAPVHAAGAVVTAPGRRGEIAAFVSAEYVNGLVANAVAFVPPVLVAHILGTTASAYFYIPWIIGVAATTLLWNVVTSFVVAATVDASAARAHLDRAIRLGLAVVLPGAAVLMLAPGPLLSVLGPEYATHGATALRLIGASLPFTGIVMLYAAFCVMNKRMWTLTALQTVGAVVLLGGAWIGLDTWGVSAPALAYLAGQVAVAMVALPAVVRVYRATGRPDAGPAWTAAAQPGAAESMPAASSDR